MKIENFFATCPRGLEALLGQELAAVGAQHIKEVGGGVGFAGSWETCYRANLESRLATRILWRVAHASYKTEEEVYKLALGLDWPEWFRVRQTLRVQVSAIKSPLRSLDFTTLRIKDAICDRFREATGERPSVDTAQPDVRVHGFFTATHVTLYLDTSGDSLTQRGYKFASVEAPIKENLAAGILKLTGWTPGVPLLDPMCGSGTFLLEAALMSLDIAPGLNRKFGFMRLLNFDQAMWERIRGEAEARCKPFEPLPIWGSDIDSEMLVRAKQNLAAAGLSNYIKLEHADMLTRTAPADHGVMVTNPPYGVRLGIQALETFYPKLGDALKQNFTGWNCYFITADPEMPKAVRLKATKRTPLFNGALECRLLEYRIVSGSNRKKLDA